MPSHRQGNIPKHRARRPDENSGRHARLNAAPPAKRIAPESSPDPGGSGAGPAAPGRRVARAPDGVIAGTRNTTRSRRMRGLLVTPWFAAGAGFVIAAALSLNAPRTFLTYRPNNTPTTSKCATCVAPESVPTSKPGVQIKSVNPAVIGGNGPASPAVRFHLGSERDGAFSVTFTLPAGPPGNGWQLQFALPGRSITGVYGAHWRSGASTDSGVAAGNASSAGRAAVSFMVSASGSPVAPAGCVLNAKPCHFR
jgi:hypothetical protein